MNILRNHFVIRRCGYSRDFEIIMLVNNNNNQIPVQTNIRTLEKAEAALKEWQRRKEVNYDPAPDAE